MKKKPSTVSPATKRRAHDVFTSEDDKDVPSPKHLATWAMRAQLSVGIQEILVTWLARQFVAEQFAKLEQGGHVEGGIRLQKVFVDLPIAERSTQDDIYHRERTFFLKALLSLKPASLALCNIATLGSQTAPIDSLNNSSNKIYPGFILIGGPGQGKSTVGQFACQLHRAALLAPFLEQLHSSQQDLIRPFTERATQKEIGWPQHPLLPIRIVLPEAAAWLAQQEEKGKDSLQILEMLVATQFVSRAIKISAEELANLLKYAPFLLVLDGLDEVGAPEDRNRLITAVRELLSNLARGGAHGLIVATTRPQGYTGELDRMGVPLSTVYLAPLQKDEAIAYGEKLAKAKVGTLTDDFGRITRGLRAAAAEPATARLLTTPLQVTILVALVQRMGLIPKERWGLFARYFDTIYDREVERGTYAATLLRDYKMHIQRIHSRVGLLLQVESEQAGGTDARMPRGRLESIADRVLFEDEVDDATRADLVRRIVRAAEERLVFLVEPEPGKFGFEIRSLQEFMAAWALAADGDELIEGRLKQVAKASTFRVVTLFLASKLFTDGSSLREILAERICGAIDADMAIVKELHLGALLALELLDEGSALNQPRYARQLLVKACELLNLPPRAEHIRLAQVASRVPEVRGKDDPLRTSIELRLSNLENDLDLAALLSLFESADIGVVWAEVLANSVWERISNPSTLLESYRKANIPINHWLLDRINKSAQKINPLSALILQMRRGANANGWIYSMQRITEARGTYYAGKSYFIMTKISDIIREDWYSIMEISHSSLNWKPWHFAAQLAVDCSSKSLAKVLRGIAEISSWKDAYRSIIFYLPWPLAACLRSADTSEDLYTYATLAESGALGDTAEWLAAEANWSFNEVNAVGNALDMACRALPWEVISLNISPPVGGIWIRFAAINTRRRWIAPLVRALREIRSLSLRSLLAGYFISWFEAPAPARELARIPWTDIEYWSEISGSISFFIIKYGLESKQQEEWLTGLERLAIGRKVTLRWTSGTQSDMEWLFSFYSSHPKQQSLCYWLRLYLTRRAGPNNELSISLSPQTRAAVLKAFADHPIENPALAADAALIRAWLGDFSSTTVAPLLAVVREQAVREPALWEDLISLLRQSSLPLAAQELFLTILLTSPDIAQNARWKAEESLRQLIQARSTGLSEPANWLRLKLPLPTPLAQATLRYGAALPENPVILSRIEVQYIRGIESLRLDIAAPTSEEGQWIVILGPNGSGKTTLLRAIVLAFRNLSNPKIWPKRAFATPWCTNDAPPGRALAMVQLANGMTFEVNIQRNGSEAFSQQPKDQPTPFPLFAYGCRRGSALGGSPREVDIGEGDGPEIATLFDEGAPLIHAETWLREWDGAAARNLKSNASIYETIRNAIKNLLNLDEIFVRDRQVLVSGASVGREVPFAALSDGYLTTAGWFLDLIARWIELARKSSMDLDADILTKMTGLVLLDEIDLHLHPRWQLDVIPRIRKLLPKMSFVVTTHNPLTLVGARPEEIWILSTEDGPVRALRGTETPMLLTSGQIYSRYFGITDIYPHEIGDALRRYGFLSSDPARTDKEEEEMQQLLGRLQAAGVEPGWDVVPREPSRRSDSRKRRSRY